MALLVLTLCCNAARPRARGLEPRSFSFAAGTFLRAAYALSGTDLGRLLYQIHQAPYKRKGLG
eukprot:1846368-Rhodomonas_salina.4